MESKNDVKHNPTHVRCIKNKNSQLQHLPFLSSNLSSFQIVNICTKEQPSKCQPCRIFNVPLDCEEFRDGTGAKQGWVRAEETHVR